MKLNQLFLALLLTLAGLSLGAQRAITGFVTGEDETPLIGVSIQIKGSTSGTVSGLDGDYSITASPSDTLIFSYTGYSTKMVRVGNQSSIDVLLSAGALLDEVVVTALGITRERKALGYAVQEINTDEITRVKQANLVNSLQGQMAGVQVTSAGGGPGQGSRIIIRGITSLDVSANNEPLFVVDGIPITNESLTVGGGAARNVSNRVADLNPQDIATMSVLKGGAATALYGLRAANGAVIITTKQGKSGRLTVELTSTYGLEEVNKFPEVQKTYTQGFGGEYDVNSFWPSWGPTVEEARAINPDHPAELFNNYDNAFETGNQLRNTISVSGGNEKAQVRASLSRFEHEGVLPFSTYNNTSFRINANYKASEKFSFGGGINYIRSGGNRVDADRFNTRLTYWAPAKDVTDYIQEDGSMNGYRFDGSSGNNPIYGEATNKFIDDVDRFVGNLKFSYSPLDFLTINYLAGIDQYSDFRSNYGQGPVYPGAPNFENNGLGFVTETRIRRRDITSNVNAVLSFDLGADFDARLLTGFDVFDSSYDRVTTGGNELDIFDLFSLNNVANLSTSSNLTNRRLLGLYSDLSVSYRNALYLTITGRNDWSSTLPQENRSFFYPSVSLGLDLGEIASLPAAISYFKLRTSYAGIGKDTNPYRTSIVYASLTPLENVTRWTRGSQRGASDLRPERTNTVEFGADMRFFENRLGLDVTWYNSVSEDQIIPVPVSSTTGFNTFVLNAGSIRNRGVEVVMRANPVKTTQFNWDLTLNYTRNRNEILDIFEGLGEIPVSSSFGYAGSSASIRLVEGQAYGNIYGRSYRRYNPDASEESGLFLDENAPLLIGDDGFPVIETEQKILGKTQPDWFAGLTNTFTYKGITLSALFDTRQGVQKYNQQGNFFAAFGTAPYTLNRNDVIVFEGVTSDGSPNTKPVWLGQGTGPDGVNYGAGYYRNTYRGSTENFVEDADWIRLRSLSLSYSLPASLLENVFLRRVTLSLTGNNLWLSTPYSGYDPEGNQGNQNGDDGFGGFTYPGVRSYFATLNVTF